MTKALFIDPEAVKQITGLSSNIDEKALRPEIMNAQETYFEEILGSALYDRLNVGIVNGDLNDHEKKLLKEYISSCLAYYTMSLLPEGLSFQMFNFGAVRLQAENTSTPTMDDVRKMSRHYLNRAETYREKLIRYLRNNTTLYPLYLTPRSKPHDKGTDKNSYTCSIFLG